MDDRENEITNEVDSDSTEFNTDRDFSDYYAAEEPSVDIPDRPVYVETPELEHDYFDQLDDEPSTDTDTSDELDESTIEEIDEVESDDISVTSGEPSYDQASFDHSTLEVLHDEVLGFEVQESETIAVEQAPFARHQAPVHAHHTVAASAIPQQQFKPTPILVPTPNAVGRSRTRKKQIPIGKISISIIIALVAIALVIFYLVPWDRTITINGQETTSKAHSTLIELVQEKSIIPVPGKLLAIDGSTIDEQGGYPYTFIVNGEMATDYSQEVKNGDSIEIEPGGDIVESYTEEQTVISAPVTFNNYGAIHLYVNDGSDGIGIKRTGEVSGIVQEFPEIDPVPQTMEFFNIDSGDDKVIALTFDDGPWKDQTEEILNILKENDAKATFFTVGSRIAGLEETVARAYNEGHQISTHSWDHASGSGQGVNLGYMTDEEQREEILKGQEAISEVTGQEASKIIRVPGGNLSERTAQIIKEFATAEIGWNIDTEDWRRPGVSAIVERILAVSPGEVILMHDGGGDRSQTIEALREALPILRDQGYKFITIDELINTYSPNTENID